MLSAQLASSDHPAANRTLIIESQLLFAKALAQTLSGDRSIDVVGDSRKMDSALLTSRQPDLIIVDIDDRDLDIADLVAAARRILPDVRICALSVHLSVEVMQRCLNAGVNGYIVKDRTPSEFVSAIKMVALGESYCDPRVAGRLLRRRSGQSESDVRDLSLRETQVVRLIVGGKSNKEISSDLSLSQKTIKNHVSHIFSKLNCTARTQVAVHALRTGLV